LPDEPGHADRIPWEERRLKWLFWAGAAGLAPWIVYLYISQIPRAPAHQIHILAVGLILSMFLGIVVTAWMYPRGFSLPVMAASFAATATFISAWFRVLTETGGSVWAGSIPTFLTVVVAIVVLCIIAIRTELSVLAQAGAHARWLPTALAIAALALVPSLVIELVAVPGIQIAQHLRVAWTGLDVFELLALAGTGLALHRRSVIAVVPATITGALLLCDAWINVIPSSAAARAEGIALAFVEVPLAALSFWVAARVARRAARAVRARAV
jgi:hypothetical protein